MPLTIDGVEIERLVHSAFRVRGNGVTVYIDPFQIPGSPRDGDVVICTHDHFDHCSPQDVVKVASPDAVIVASENCRDKVSPLGFKAYFLSPGEKVSVKGVEVEAVPAYNVGKRFHPRGYGGIGVLLRIGGVTIYHAGDTDYIPEMEQLRGRVDVALLPVSGVYVMSPEEAARAAEVIQPRVAVPMHYGAIVGDRGHAERFAKLLEGKVRVEII